MIKECVVRCLLQGQEGGQLVYGSAIAVEFEGLGCPGDSVVVFQSVATRLRGVWESMGSKEARNVSRDFEIGAIEGWRRRTGGNRGPRGKTCVM